MTIVSGEKNAERSKLLLLLAMAALLTIPLSHAGTHAHPAGGDALHLGNHGFAPSLGERFGPMWQPMTNAPQRVAPLNQRLAQAPADLSVRPMRGQSRRQLDADRMECHRLAVKRAGYDPNHASTGFQVGQKRLDYDHAISTCLESRGYTAK
jgi:hypothetical protein